MVVSSTGASATVSGTESASAPDPVTLRRQFLLDPEVTFLNHGSFGACPAVVFERYQAFQLELEREPVEFIGRRQKGLLDAARAQLATYLDTDADDISFVINATSGLNVIARSIPLNPGDEILTTDLEYGALDFTWEHLCTKAGASYVKQHIPLPAESSEAIVDALWAGVTDRTCAIFLSHITSGTAITLPVKQICDRAREADILTIIDGAHAPGQIPLDLRDLGADIYSGNCHKWMCAPKGSAFLYVCPEHQEWVESLTISWGWRPEHTFVTRNQQQGTRDVAAWLSVPAAIDFLNLNQWDRVRGRCHAMLSDLRQRLAHDFKGLTPLSPDAPEWYSQMATIPIPATDPAVLHHRLFERYGIEVPVNTYDDRQYVRVSVQGYTTADDLDHLERALVQELA